VARERKYTLDSNLYIDAFRTTEANAALQIFHTAFAPFEYLSAVVVQELRAGARANGRAAAALQRNVFDPFERRDRVFVPSYGAWKMAGEVMASLARRGLLDWRNLPRAFINDVLLAMSCREAGIVLVTANTRDFARIATVKAFAFVAPWPSPVR
jgi:predicted nucleic acid-binding protein